jgi:hypothetical protein
MCRNLTIEYILTAALQDYSVEPELKNHLPSPDHIRNRATMNRRPKSHRILYSSGTRRLMYTPWQTTVLSWKTSFRLVPGGMPTRWLIQTSVLDAVSASAALSLCTY